MMHDLTIAAAFCALGIALGMLLSRVEDSTMMTARPPARSTAPAVPAAPHPPAKWRM